MSFEEDRCKDGLYKTMRREVKIIDAGRRKNSMWRMGTKRILIKYSKEHTNGYEQYYFFGVRDGVFTECKYVLFICGTTEQMILIPTLEFAKLSNEVPLSQNQVKLHIFSGYGKFELSLTDKSRIDLTNYLKNEPELIKALSDVR